MKQATAILALLLAGCNDGEIVWVQFNKDGQALKVEVGPDEAPCPEDAAQAAERGCLIELESNLGVTQVGTATVDPASGPVGTNHLVTVIVFDDFEALVGRATVVVSSTRTSDPDGDGESEPREGVEFEMRRDSADIGAYALTLQSLGAPVETGTDTFTIRLFQPEELAAEPAE